MLEALGPKWLQRPRVGGRPPGPAQDRQELRMLLLLALTAEDSEVALQCDMARGSSLPWYPVNWGS